MSKTADNLRESFVGESQANRRYLAFSRKAEDEGMPEVARLFRAAAEAETVHAFNHIRVMGEVKSTADNLAAAVSGETFEFMKMYPQYLELAKQEGNPQAAWSFDVANKVEQVHAALFTKMIEALRKGEKFLSVDYHVCSVCGNTIEGEAPERCPVCGASKMKFFKVA